MSEYKLVIDGAKMAELMSAAGPVGEFLITRATAFQTKARAQAPVKTGCLRASIVKRAIVETGGALSIMVISDTTPCSPTRTSYSYWVHEGTKPHVITANKANVLAFYWANGPNGPGTYFFQSVHHPGTKANRFLTDSLYLFGTAL